MKFISVYEEKTTTARAVIISQQTNFFKAVAEVVRNRARGRRNCTLYAVKRRKPLKRLLTLL